METNRDAKCKAEELIRVMLSLILNVPEYQLCLKDYSDSDENIMEAKEYAQKVVLQMFEEHGCETLNSKRYEHWKEVGEYIKKFGIKEYVDGK